MVQPFLSAKMACRRRLVHVIALSVLLSVPCFASKIRIIHKDKEKTAAQLAPPPDILLEGGRKLVFESSFASQKDVRKKPGFWGKVINVVAGEPDNIWMVRPYSIAVDSRGREIITDPGAAGVHIFDFAQHKYKFLSRDSDKDPLLAPQCVAVDAADNIYITDSLAGKIFVYDSNLKLRHVLGSKRGEGFFKRPTGISVDSAAQRIYVTDTLRNKVFVLAMDGTVLQSFGNRGVDDAQFNFPTEVLVHGSNLFVVDAMNFRVQTIDSAGQFKMAIGVQGNEVGGVFRPKGIAFDSEDHLYVVDASLNAVQVFNRQGDLLYYFGGSGNGLGQFRLPSGLFIDHGDHVYVVDSYNHRVQVFRYVAAPKQVSGGRQ